MFVQSALAVALLVSISFHIKGYLDRKKKKPPLSVDARQLLHDLSHGGAIVKVTVIDPEGLLIYRGDK